MANQSTYDHLFKILLIGDSSVGKSSILIRFTEDRFDEKQLATCGVDFKVKYMQVRDKCVKLAVWDTAGQERFRTLTSSYYRGAQAIILVYDCTEPQTFQNIRNWLNEVSNYSTNQDAIKMLIANKIDKSDRVKVEREEGQRFAFDQSMMFIETSAKTKVGIEHAFEEVVQKILDTPNLLSKSVPIRGTTRLGEGDESRNTNDSSYVQINHTAEGNRIAI